MASSTKKRDTYRDFHLIRKVKQLTETGMVGISYFNHRKRKVSRIFAGGRLRKNNQALSYLSKVWPEFCARRHSCIMAFSFCYNSPN